MKMEFIVSASTISSFRKIGFAIKGEFESLFGLESLFDLIRISN
jgi:hypothetical protein